jgi:hypothetical protein
LVDLVDSVDPVDPPRGCGGLLDPLTHAGAPFAVTGTIYATRMINRIIIRMVNLMVNLMVRLMVNRNSPAR